MMVAGGPELREIKARNGTQVADEPSTAPTRDTFCLFPLFQILQRAIVSSSPA